MTMHGLANVKFSEVIFRSILVQNRIFSMQVTTALSLMINITQYKDVLIKICSLLNPFLEHWTYNQV